MTFIAALVLMIAALVVRFAVGDGWAAIVGWAGLVLLLAAMASDELLWLHQRAQQSGSWVRALSDWREKPRESLEVHWRLYLLGGLLTFGLIYGGGSVLIGPGQTMRWAGALALVTGLSLGAILALIVGRPGASK